MMISNNQLRELLARKRLVNVCSFPLETLLHLDSLMKCNCLDQFACEVVACGRLPPGCRRHPHRSRAPHSQTEWLFRQKSCRPSQASDDGEFRTYRKVCVAMSSASRLPKRL